MGSLVKDATGTLVLTDTETYLGSTTINAGTLSFAGANGAYQPTVAASGNETQSIRLNGVITGGTFSLMFGGAVTAPIGYGSPIQTGTVGLTQVGTTVTVATTLNHNFAVGQSVVIAGADVTAYNGTFVVTSIVSPTSFTYTNPATGLAASGGGSAVLAGTSLATAIQSALNATLGAGNTVVSGTGPFNVAFQGSFAGLALPTLGVNYLAAVAVPLTGTAPAIVVTATAGRQLSMSTRAARCSWTTLPTTC